MHVAVSGSYAYVAGHTSYSLVVVDISNPASPVIRGSVVSSSLLYGVRATQFCDRGWPQAPRHASAPPIVLAPAAPRPLMPSRAFARALSRAVCTGDFRRRERLVRLRDGAVSQLAGGDRH